MPEEKQLELLGQLRPPHPLTTLRQRLRPWADRGVFFGGSSWKYEGWLGQVYTRDRYLVRGKLSQARFERECLAEYAETFPTVCGDFSFYQFYSHDFWKRLFEQVPGNFQFGFKAPEIITAPEFPNHERYGAQRGKPNETFLNADLIRANFLDRLEPHRAQVGYIAFQFPQFHRATPASLKNFTERLDTFFRRLPGSFRYGVEIRNKELLGTDYFDCLRRHRVAHVFNSWTRMPPIGEQLDLEGSFTADHVIARVLLKPGRSYEEAVKLFQPYDQVRDPYPQGYKDVARLVRTAGEKTPKTRTFIAVNNRFVGNAVVAISEILDELEKAGV